MQRAIRSPAPAPPAPPRRALVELSRRVPMTVAMIILIALKVLCGSEKKTGQARLTFGDMVSIFSKDCADEKNNRSSARSTCVERASWSLSDGRAATKARPAGFAFVHLKNLCNRILEQQLVREILVLSFSWESHGYHLLGLSRGTTHVIISEESTSSVDSAFRVDDYRLLKPTTTKRAFGAMQHLVFVRGIPLKDIIRHQDWVPSLFRHPASAASGAVVGRLRAAPPDVPTSFVIGHVDHSMTSPFYVHKIAHEAYGGMTPSIKMVAMVTRHVQEAANGTCLVTAATGERSLLNVNMLRVAESVVPAPDRHGGLKFNNRVTIDTYNSNDGSRFTGGSGTETRHSAARAHSAHLYLACTTTAQS
ncbi:hypothetical protein EVAR_102694_1 [Eumeta japonica]|uniref:Uncharacterized protein n=1 Tax=Eumeta variegata TaxID=151549 RepID=A0A4C1THM7_EUMVA|nr:hypothetical protein EVAR_102694_1 [Eumeta japonica]